MRFRGYYDFLSNFYPCDIAIGGITFPSSENAYHYFRTNDEDAKKKFIVLPPAGAKKLAKKCRTKPNWDEIKLGVMRYVCEQKFAQNSYLALLLIDTLGETLIEHNWWGDTFWGVCNGIGENHLGKILMDIRRMELNGKLRPSG